MEINIPKCNNNRDCVLICSFKKCKAIPFMCINEQCKCYDLHKQCISSMRWKNMKQILADKLKKSSNRLHQYFEQIKKLYQSVQQQIKASCAIYNISEDYGLTEIQKEVYQKLKEKKYAELNGQIISRLDTDFSEQQKQFRTRNIQKQKKLIKEQTLSLLKIFEEIKIHPVLSSVITQDLRSIQGFFQKKKIASIDLLFRASQNNFQVNKFHDKCDGIQNTITIIKTQYGNVIGGYTPCPWSRALIGKYQKDESKQSFIFSLTNKHKLNLKAGKQGNAIYQYGKWGPCFGNNDIYISDKANQNEASGANVGNSYINNEYIYQSQQSIKKFSGQRFGKNYKICQWEVYKIVFL